MKTKILILTLAATAVLTAGGASAQRYDRDDRHAWMPINERQRQLDHRIDVGMRNGQLTRQEAYRLRGEFRRIAYLENRYRRDGLSGRERADLDRRFDALSAQIRYERRDGERYGYNGHRPYR
jgi:Ni/Co efflux regulator RcnB